MTKLENNIRFTTFNKLIQFHFFLESLNIVKKAIPSVLVQRTMNRLDNIIELID